MIHEIIRGYVLIGTCSVHTVSHTTARWNYLLLLGVFRLLYRSYLGLSGKFYLMSSTHCRYKQRLTEDSLLSALEASMVYVAVPRDKVLNKYIHYSIVYLLLKTSTSFKILYIQSKKVLIYK